MKKILLMATAAAMLFASCAKENSANTDAETVNLTVKIANIEGSRAIQAPGTATSAILWDATLFVFKADGDLLFNPISLNTGAVTGTGAGQVVPGVPSNAKIFIMGNIATLPTAELNAINAITTLTGLQGIHNAIIFDRLYTNAVLSNLSGPQGITGITDGVAEMTVTLAPVYARMELAGLVGSEYREMNAGNPTGYETRIINFTVTGVAVDDMYEEYTFTANYHFGDLYKMKQVWDCHTSFSDIGEWPADGSPLTAKPDDGNYWGYNVPAGNLPRFVIAVKDIEYEESFNSGTDWAAPAISKFAPGVEYYITVGSYNNQDLNAFLRGTIYQLKADGGLSFTTENIHVHPNVTDVELTVTLNIEDWIVVPSNPIVG